MMLILAEQYLAFVQGEKQLSLWFAFYFLAKAR